LNLPLEVRRKVVCWFPTRRDVYRLDRGGPVFGFETHGGFFYGFPTTGDEPAIKVAEHTGGHAIDHPDTMDRNLHASDVERVGRFIADCLPAVDPAPTRHIVCMYTMTPDEHFIVDHHPTYEHVFIAAGFSGHGFKFGPVVGEALADLITTGQTDAPVGFLSVNRPALRAFGAGADPRSG
jgi:N-methyl-L-tryptophan oxidase